MGQFSAFCCRIRRTLTAVFILSVATIPQVSMADTPVGRSTIQFTLDPSGCSQPSLTGLYGFPPGSTGFAYCFTGILLSSTYDGQVFVNMSWPTALVGGLASSTNCLGNMTGSQVPNDIWSHYFILQNPNGSNKYFQTFMNSKAGDKVCLVLGIPENTPRDQPITATLTVYTPLAPAIADAPTLPQWAAIILGTLLLLAILYRHRDSSSSLKYR